MRPRSRAGASGKSQPIRGSSPRRRRPPEGARPEFTAKLSDPEVGTARERGNTDLIPLFGAQEVAGHVLREHVGHQGLVPAAHLGHALLLVVDVDLPQEQGPGQLFHLGIHGGNAAALPVPPAGGSRPRRRVWDEGKP